MNTYHEIIVIKSYELIFLFIVLSKYLNYRKNYTLIVEQQSKLV
jgi:hypothetical protein